MFHDVLSALLDAVLAPLVVRVLAHIITRRIDRKRPPRD